MDRYAPSASGSSFPRAPDTHRASLLATRPAPLRVRMHSADGTHTHEHAHDRDVSSANAANDLTSLTASATPENPTVHSRAASGVPGASDASLCVEAGSASTTTPTTFASAHARAEDAGTTESACKRCANPGNHKRLHTCNLKRAQPAFGSRERSSRKRMLSLPGPPEPRAEPTPPRVQLAKTIPHTDRPTFRPESQGFKRSPRTRHKPLLTRTQYYSAHG